MLQDPFFLVTFILTSIPNTIMMTYQILALQEN